MSEQKYFISRNYQGQASASGKAKIDCELVLEKSGYKNLGLPRFNIANSVIGFFITLASTLIGLVRLPFKSTLVVQYPTKKYYNFIVRVAKLKGCKVVTIIHDLRSFRKQKMSVATEMKSLNRNDVIIAHNIYMSKWLKDSGLTSHLVELEIFDYFTDKENTYTPNLDDDKPFSLVFAGVLEKRKNGFIYKVDELEDNQLGFNLYGVGFDPKALRKDSFIDYKGVFPADEIVSRLEGELGVVWDGISIEECAGSFGEYLKVNNPHKTSMYLRAGLPIVIWDKAAIAKFVIDNNVGIAVSSLADVEAKVKQLSKEDYLQMRANAAKVSKKLGEGYFFRTALEKAYAHCNPA